MNKTNLIIDLSLSSDEEELPKRPPKNVSISLKRKLTTEPCSIDLCSSDEDIWESYTPPKQRVVVSKGNNIPLHFQNFICNEIHGSHRRFTKRYRC